MKRRTPAGSLGSLFPGVNAALLGLACLAGPGKAAGGDWPGWRGADRTGLAQETGLLAEWPKEGPPLLWKVSGLGTGYASLAVAGDQIFTTGDRGKKAHAFALRRADGSELWSSPLGDGWNDGGTRSTPTVAGELVFALTPHGDLVCLRIKDGSEAWRKNLERDLGGRMMSGWGYSESVLIDGDRVICTPGGDKATIAALNRETGDVVWKAAVPDAGGAGYASPVAAEIAGVRQYITLLGKSGGIAGVAAKDGKLLWRHNRVANGTANIPTPIVKGDLVFYTTGYDDGGSALLRIVPDGERFRVEEKYVLKARELQNHHGGVVLVGEHLFGGHGHNNGFPFCLDLESGKETWGKKRGPGTGSAAVVYADGKLYFRYENAVMALIEANPKELKILGSFKIPEGKTPSWSHPVVAGGRLYLRDQDRLLCYDVKAPSR